MREGFKPQPRLLSEQEKIARAIENETKADRIASQFYYEENGEKIPFTPDALVVVSGGLERVLTKDEIPVRDSYKGYKTASYNDLDNKGLTSGGKARVIAAADAYKTFPKTKVFTNSKDVNLNSERPTYAAVYKHELLSYEVLEADILSEEDSINTLTMLLELVQIVQSEQTNLRTFALITNEYHIERIKTMIAMLPQLADTQETKNEVEKFFASGKKLIPIAAEGILKIRDSRYAMLFDQVKHSPEYQARLAAEAQGIKDLLAGTYNANLPSKY